jgi:hypothetical protein
MILPVWTVITRIQRLHTDFIKTQGRAVSFCWLIFHSDINWLQTLLENQAFWLAKKDGKLLYKSCYLYLRDIAMNLSLEAISLCKQQVLFPASPKGCLHAKDDQTYASRR